MTCILWNTIQKNKSAKGYLMKNARPELNTCRIRSFFVRLASCWEPNFNKTKLTSVRLLILHISLSSPRPSSSLTKPSLFRNLSTRSSGFKIWLSLNSATLGSSLSFCGTYLECHGYLVLRAKLEKHIPQTSRMVLTN